MRRAEGLHKRSAAERRNPEVHPVEEHHSPEAHLVEAHRSLEAHPVEAHRNREARHSPVAALPRSPRHAVEDRREHRDHPAEARTARGRASHARPLDAAGWPRRTQRMCSRRQPWCRRGDGLPAEDRAASKQPVARQRAGHPAQARRKGRVQAEECTHPAHPVEREREARILQEAHRAEGHRKGRGPLEGRLRIRLPAVRRPARARLLRPWAGRPRPSCL